MSGARVRKDSGFMVCGCGWWFMVMVWGWGLWLRFVVMGLWLGLGFTVGLSNLSSCLCLLSSLTWGSTCRLNEDQINQNQSKSNPRLNPT